MIVLFTSSVTSASAAAYEASAGNGYRITEESALYQVTFEWGFTGRDVLIPVFATRGLGATEATSTLGYEFITENGLRTKDGLGAALVLADAPIENGYYRLKSGEIKTFTVLGIFTHEPSITSKYAFAVSGLPFIIEKGGSQSHTALNARELTGFVTNPI